MKRLFNISLFLIILIYSLGISSTTIVNANCIKAPQGGYGNTERCELPDKSIQYCTTQSECQALIVNAKAAPEKPALECVQRSFSGGTCLPGYTGCPTGPSFGYCCKNVNDCDEYQERETQAILEAQKAKKFSICSSAGAQQGECEQCYEKGGVLTAIGCIKTSFNDFIAGFLSIAIGIAGGIALLLMVYGAFLISVSAGDPKKADEGKEIITGAIAGLLFIIFSVFLLRLIGVQILNIPGF